MLISLDQNGKQPVNPCIRRGYTDKALPAEGRVLIRELVIYTELGKSLSLSFRREKADCKGGRWG